jgi:hypothetical protein
MSKPKHTPGPWKAEKHGNAIEVWNQNTFVCSLDGKEFRTAHSQFEDEPNARLIAAAPEMLETIKRVFENLEGSRFKNQLCPELAKLEYMIRKVEGDDKP